MCHLTLAYFSCSLGGCDTHFPLPQQREGELTTGAPAGELSCEAVKQYHQVTRVSLLGKVGRLLKLVRRSRELNSPSDEGGTGEQ